jgi:Bifunctional DNA primase/polymerase, N-terminal
VFSQWQPVYAEHGIATIPCDQSKRPLVRQPQKFGCKASAEIASKFPDTLTFGYYTGCGSGITVLDIDTPHECILAAALDRHGSSPIIVRTGSGKFHALYRHNGERRSIRPWGKDLPIDLLGAGLCIAPPSVVTKGSYKIIEGHLDDLDRLPIMRGLEDRLYCRHHTGPRPRGDWSAMREGNGRNNQLWRQLMHEANHCDAYEQLIDRAHTLNRTVWRTDASN